MTTAAPDQTQTNGAANGAPAPEPQTAPAEPAAEPTLTDRRAKLAEVAKAEKAKLQARQREQAQLQQLAAQVEAERQARLHIEAQARQLQAELQKDPLELLEARGITAKQIADRILKKGTPDAKLEEALQAIKAKEQQYEQTLQALRERELRAQHAQAQAAARKQLADTFDSVKSECPILSKMSPGKLEAEYLAAYQSLTNDPETRGYTYSDAEILKAVEAKKRAELEDALDAFELEKIEAVLTKRRGSASVTETSSSASSPPALSAAKVTQATKTLTAAAVSSKGSGWKPANFEKLSEREQNRILVEAMAKGLLK